MTKEEFHEFLVKYKRYTSANRILSYTHNARESAREAESLSDHVLQLIEEFNQESDGRLQD